MSLLAWIGIGLCISQSAMLSGLNLAFITMSRLELRIEAANNNRYARRVLSLREDANFLLVTILWGNSAVNVFLRHIHISGKKWIVIIDQDVILLWGENKRVITGADVLGRLLRGIVQNAGTIDSSAVGRLH